MSSRVSVRRVVLVLCGAMVLVVLGINIAVGESSRGAIFDERDVPQTETALVFGAGVEADGSPSAMLADRLDLALRLYRTGKVRRILLSGDDRAGDREITAMRARMRSAGVPRDRVVIDDRGFSTRDSCVRARALFGLRSATLVTQAFHLRRALFVCRANGLDGVGVGVADWGAYSIATMVPHVVRELLATTVAAFRAGLHG